MSDEKESVTLRSGDFSAKVMREGAELRSFLHTPSGREFIWQADPEIWGSSAPVLFPIVGKLKDDRYTWRGQSFSMSGHGVVRRREFQVTELGEDHVMLQFDADSTSLAAFPFPFTLQVEFVLSGTLLNVDYRVSNTGTEVMPFTLAIPKHHGEMRCYGGGKNVEIQVMKARQKVRNTAAHSAVVRAAKQDVIGYKQTRGCLAEHQGHQCHTGPTSKGAMSWLGWS